MALISFPLGFHIFGIYTRLSFTSLVLIDSLHSNYAQFLIYAAKLIFFVINLSNFSAAVSLIVIHFGLNSIPNWHLTREKSHDEYTRIQLCCQACKGLMIRPTQIMNTPVSTAKIKTNARQKILKFCELNIKFGKIYIKFRAKCQQQWANSLLSDQNWVIIRNLSLNWKLKFFKTKFHWNLFSHCR